MSHNHGIILAQASSSYEPSSNLPFVVYLNASLIPPVHIVSLLLSICWWWRARRRRRGGGGGLSMASWGTLVAKLGRGQDDSLGGFLVSLGRPLGGISAVFLGPPGPHGGLLGASWVFLGASWRPLRAKSSKWPFGSSVWALSWSRLGGLLGRLGCLLGSLGALLGRFGALLETSWAVLGRSWSVAILAQASCAMGGPRQRARTGAGALEAAVRWLPGLRPAGRRLATTCSRRACGAAESGRQHRHAPSRAGSVARSGSGLARPVRRRLPRAARPSERRCRRTGR